MDHLPGKVMSYININYIINKYQYTKLEKIPFPECRGHIHCDKISFMYQKSPVFSDLSFTIVPQQRIVLTGRSGSGKSTLIKLLLGFYPVQSGMIYIDQLPLDSLSIEDVRKHIHYSNQRTTLYNDTIFNNMIYGTNCQPEEALALVSEYQLLHIFESLDRMVEKNGINMSMGMQKVIITIRSILTKASIYIFDEPLASLDEKTKQIISRMIKEKTVGKTVLIITHDTTGFEFVDQIIPFSSLSK